MDVTQMTMVPLLPVFKIVRVLIPMINKECQSGFYLSSDHESCNQIEHCTNSNVDNKKTCKTFQEVCYPYANTFCICIPGCKTVN